MRRSKHKCPICNNDCTSSHEDLVYECRRHQGYIVRFIIDGTTLVHKDGFTVKICGGHASLYTSPKLNFIFSLIVSLSDIKFPQEALTRLISISVFS